MNVSNRALKQSPVSAGGSGLGRVSPAVNRPLPGQQQHRSRVSPRSLAEWSDAVSQSGIDAVTTVAASELIVRSTAVAHVASLHSDSGSLLGHLHHALSGSSSLFQASLQHVEPSATAQVFANVAEATQVSNVASTLSVVDTTPLQELMASSAPVIADIGTSPGVAMAADTAVNMAADAAQASVLALATWASERLSGLEAVDPQSVAAMQTTMRDMVSELQNVVDMQATTATLGWTNALVLGVQQLVTTLRLTGTGGSSIEAMVAAQQAMESAIVGGVGPLGGDGVVKITLATLALAAASIPRPGFLSGGSQPVPGSADGLPLLYEPKALDAYFAQRPMLVLQRNSQVFGKFGAFATKLLVDWRTGKIKDREHRKKQAKEFGRIVEDLGPAYIKMAQQLSTRVDLIPELYLEELKRLQDNVKTFSTVEARVVLEDGLGRPVDQVFEWLSAEPLAAASLGQVYRGKLKDSLGGQEVAVKVQRPLVLESVALDIYIMRRAVVMMSMMPFMSDQWSDVLDDWAGRFFEEMDYQREANNTMAFKKSMAALQGITVATVMPELTSRKVIITEWVEGEKLNHSRAEDVRALCSTLLNCYLIQLLETGLLHADPHPGNLLRTSDGRIVILDFGLMTEVTEDQRVALVEFIAHLTMEDWKGVTRDLAALGFMPDGMPENGEELIAPVLQQVMGQIVKGGGLRGFNIANMTAELQGVAISNKMCIPPYFALVLRAFCVIEGIALKVDPDYAIVQECMPYLSRRLLTDNNPRMRAALRQLLYGNKNRLDVERLSKMISAFGSYSTSVRQAAGPTFSSAAERAYDERVKGQVSRNADDGPVVNEATKEVLKVVFSKDGSYAQELMVEELVAAVDAMSREAMGEALRMVVSSAGAVTALRSVEALGPLRSMLMPLPLPMEMLSSMAAAPAVQLTSEDRQALAMVRTILDLLQPSLNRIPDVAVSSGRAIRAAGELMPMVPELLPGMRTTLELFMRQLVRRMALRLADDLAAASPLQQQSQPATAGGAGASSRR